MVIYFAYLVNLIILDIGYPCALRYRITFCTEVSQHLFFSTVYELNKTLNAVCMHICARKAHHSTSKYTPQKVIIVPLVFLTTLYQGSFELNRASSAVVSVPLMFLTPPPPSPNKPVPWFMTDVSFSAMFG